MSAQLLNSKNILRERRRHRQQSRVSRQISEIKELLDARRFEREVFNLKYEQSALRFQLAAVRFVHVCRKAGFKEDQPRWPGGSGDNSGRWSGGAGSGVTVSTSTGFLTGISTIDNTSKALSETLVRVMQNLNFIPESSPPSVWDRGSCRIRERSPIAKSSWNRLQKR